MFATSNSALFVSKTTMRYFYQMHRMTRTGYVLTARDIAFVQDVLGRSS